MLGMACSFSWPGQGRQTEAIETALEPFEGIVDELLASIPRSGLGLT
jgi:hypothetical protein